MVFPESCTPEQCLKRTENTFLRVGPTSQKLAPHEPSVGRWVKPTSLPRVLQHVTPCSMLGVPPTSLARVSAATPKLLQMREQLVPPNLLIDTVLRGAPAREHDTNDVALLALPPLRHLLFVVKLLDLRGGPQAHHVRCALDMVLHALRDELRRRQVVVQRTQQLPARGRDAANVGKPRRLGARVPTTDERIFGFGLALRAAGVAIPPEMLDPPSLQSCWCAWTLPCVPHRVVWCCSSTHLATTR